MKGALALAIAEVRPTVLGIFSVTVETPNRTAVRSILALCFVSITALEGDFDADSRWALTWFEQSGFDEGDYGVAEQLSKSKNTSITGMVQAGMLESKRGKVRLLKPEELAAAWDPATDPRLTGWEIVHHLIRVLACGGEGAAAALLAKLGTRAFHVLT
jgi:putative DNA methylase